MTGKTGSDKEALRSLSRTIEGAAQTASAEERLLALKLRQSVLVESALAHSTQRAYGQCWRQFVRFCETHGLKAEVAASDEVALFLCSLDRPSRSRVQQLVAAIRWRLDRMGRPLNPAEDGDLRRVARALALADAGRPVRRARPIRRGELISMLAPFSDGPKDRRDRALLILGYAGALRRSEIAALDLADIECDLKGQIALTIRKSKMDQVGYGRRLILAKDPDMSLDPAKVLSAWLELRGQDPGPLFGRMRRGERITGERLSGHAIGRVIKKRARQAGLPAEVISGHALRAGWITDADAGGATLGDIVQHSRHRDPASVLTYMRSTSR